MTETYLLLCSSAVLGGMVNAIAGGGTLLTFPVLWHALGGTPAAAVLANGTSTVALVPGAMSSFWAYRREVGDSRALLKQLSLPALLGGAVGTLLVIIFPASVFKALIPWLIFGAALLMALQPQIARWTGIGKHHVSTSRKSITAAIAFQFVVSIYGGYFGAGTGILMLVALAMMGLQNIHQMNALKSWLGSLINAVSAGVWIAAGLVRWDYAVAMAISAILGGYFGAHFARKLHPKLVRAIVVVIGFALAAYYFVRPLLGWQ